MSLVEPERAKGVGVYQAKGELEQLMASVNQHMCGEGGKRVDGLFASTRTVTVRREALLGCARRLHRLGFKLTHVSNLTTKHIAALCADWHGSGLANSTMKMQLSALRIMCEGLGKRGMVGPLEQYLPEVEKKTLKVRTVAIESKSWSEAGLDVEQKIMQAVALDERFGAMVFLMAAFGLRRKEALCLKPWKCDAGSVLKISGFTAKNGRDRNIRREVEFQSLALAYAKSVCRKNQALGWPDRTLVQNIARYNQYMIRLGITKADCGVTGHGLRAEYAENVAVLAGLIPPVLGGTKHQMTKDERLKIQAEVSEKMGHARTVVTGSYYGSFRTAPKS